MLEIAGRRFKGRSGRLDWSREPSLSATEAAMDCVSTTLRH